VRVVSSRRARKGKKGVKGERQRGWPLLQWHGGEAEDGGQAARDATWRARGWGPVIGGGSRPATAGSRRV
jgi:hypothetical protein